MPADGPFGTAVEPIITNDSTVRLTNVATTRASLLTYVWGTASLPTAAPNAVVTRPTSFTSTLLNITTVANLGAIHELDFDVGAGIRTVTYELIPTQSNGKLAIVHLGHDETTDNNGPNVLAASLVASGYTVLYAMMPCWHTQSSYEACPVAWETSGSPGGAHNDMFATLHPTSGHVQRYFFEHLARSITYLAGSFTEIDMVGLSGGGWTTSLYAAMDPRIATSIAVDGSKPTYLRRCATISAGCLDSGDGTAYDGDHEQMDPGFFNSFGYPDLYALAGAGAGRRHVQIEGRIDGVFGQSAYNYDPYVGALRPPVNPMTMLPDFGGPSLSWDRQIHGTPANNLYETNVANFLVGLGPCCDNGFFRLTIDEDGAGFGGNSHAISATAQEGIVLAELDGQRVPFGAVSATDVFVRGLDRTLRHGPPSWSGIVSLDLGGAPSVVASAGATDVFVRDQTDTTGTQAGGDRGAHISQVHLTSGSPVVTDWGGIINSDPAAVAFGSGFQVFAIGTDRRLYEWYSAGGLQVVSTASNWLVGTPAVVTNGGNIDVFARRMDAGCDGCFQHVYWRGATWQEETLPGTYRGVPSAVIAGGTTLRVYGRGTDDRLWEVTAPAGTSGMWSSASVSAHATGAGGVAVLGNPTAALLPSGQPIVVARDGSGNLATFQLTTSWQYASWAPPSGRHVTLSPLAIGSGAYARMDDRTVWRYSTGAPTTPTALYGQID